MATTQEILNILILAEDRASAQLGAATAQVSALGAAVKAARIAVAATGIAAAAALIASVKAASDFNTSFTAMVNNTTLSTRAIAAARAGILSLSAQAGAPLSQLQTGFMHVSDLGFSAGQSMTILQAAMQSALSTGADVGAVANTLALQLHDFGYSAKQAATIMNVLHLASAESNTTLEQFSTSASKAITTAANLHVPITQVDAALAALSRHMPLGQASTALAGFMQKIINPSKAAQKELELLSQKSHVNLVADFSGPGLRAKGLTGVLADLHTALTRVGGDSSGILSQLIPATRGGIAAMALLGTASQDYRTILSKLNDTLAGKTDPTAQAFARYMATAGAQMQILGANVQVLGIALGTVLLPPLTQLVRALVPVVQHFVQWATVHAQLVDAILAVTAAVGLLAGGTLILGLVFGPLATTIGAIGAPLLLVAAASTFLYEAWTRDWGGIQKKVQVAWDGIKPVLEGFRESVQNLLTDFHAGGLGQVWQNLLPDARPLTSQLQQLGGTVRTGLASLGAPLKGGASVLWSWIQAATPPAIAQLKAWGSALAGWLGQTGIPTLAAALARGETALWGWIQRAAPPALAQLKAWGSALAGWLGSTGIPDLAAALNRGETALWNWIARAIPPAEAQLTAWGTALTTWLRTTGLPDLAAALGGGASILSGWAAKVSWSHLTGDLTSAIQNAANGVNTWMDSTLIPWMHTMLDPHIQSWYDATHGIKWAVLGSDMTTAIQNAANAVNSWMDSTLVPWLHTQLDPHIQAWYDAKHGIKWAALGTEMVNAIQDAAVSVNSWMDSTLVPWLHVQLDPHIQSWYDSKHGIKWASLGTEMVTGIQNAAVGVNSWMDSTLVPWLHAKLDPSISSWYDGTHGIKWANLSQDLDTGIWNAMQATGGMVDKATAWLTNYFDDAVSKQFANAGTWLLQPGKDVVQGFINGLTSAPGTIKDAAKTMAATLITTAKSFLGIRSPSTVFRDIGQQTAQGFVEGLQSQVGTIRAAVQGVFSQVRQIALTAVAGTGVVVGTALATSTASAAGYGAQAYPTQTATQIRAQYATQAQAIQVQDVGSNPAKLVADLANNTKQMDAALAQLKNDQKTYATQHLQDLATTAARQAASYAADISGISGVQRARDNAHLHDLQYLASEAAIKADTAARSGQQDAALAALKLGYQAQQVSDQAAVKAAQAQVSQQKLQQTANEDTASAHAYAVSMAGLTGVKLAQAQLTLTEKEGVATVATLKAQDYTNQKKFATDYAAYILSQDAKVRADQTAITAAQNLVKQQALEGQVKVAQAVVQTAQQQVNSLTGVAQARAVVTLDEKQETLAIAQLKVTDFGNQKKYLADLATLTLQWGATINAAKNNVVTVQAVVTNAAKEAKAQATAALLSIRDGLKNLVDQFTLAVKQGNMVVAQALAGQITGYEQANAAALKLTPSLISDQSAKDAQTIQSAMATAAKHAETLAKQAATAAKAQATAGLKPLTEQLQLAELQKNRGAAQAAAAAITAYEQANGAALGMDATQTQINAVKMTQAIDKLSTAAAAGGATTSGMVLLRPQATSLGTLQASFGATTAYGGGSNAGTGTAEGGYSQQTATNTASMLDQLTTAVGTLEVIAGNTMPKQIRLAQRRPSHPFVK